MDYVRGESKHIDKAIKGGAERHETHSCSTWYDPLTLDGVVLHAHQEAGGELGAGGARVKERGGCVREPALGQQVVRLNGCRGQGGPYGPRQRQ